MVLEYKNGKIIMTPHEIVVKTSGENMVVMQASAENVVLIGNGANVLSANTGDMKWSIKLDSEEHLTQIAQQLGCEIM
ncbi:DUF3389 family protein [Vibrio marisflavi]|uniref:DUF3389 domain-containing protein n=1 Tax=Vibrio marisflavi CECT 7928 TaxID=634439 RepID=A0ABN8E302_9VIBR|nr:DUF3389 family protein [Vibrio marisflavi]CAH0536870.1 hypothetical protein VMF7928_00761 [Vibrio marisflavi CECT 7928]